MLPEHCVIAQGIVPAFQHSRIFRRFKNLLKFQIQRLKNQKPRKSPGQRRNIFPRTNVQLVFIASSILEIAGTLTIIMEGLDEAQKASMLNEIEVKLGKISDNLQQHEHIAMLPNLDRKVALLNAEQKEFLHMLSAFPMNLETQATVVALRQKMDDIITTSRESGSIQGELTLVSQMKELLALLQMITVNLSEAYMNSSERLPLLAEGDDALWRRLVAIPDDPSNEEMSLQQIHDELMVGVTGSRSGLITSSEASEDINTEDGKIGRNRSRNRQKRKGRRNVSSVDIPAAAPADWGSDHDSTQPLDLSVANDRSRSCEEDSELTPVPHHQFPKRPRSDSPMPRGGSFGSGLDHGYSYAVAYTPTKDASSTSATCSACDVPKMGDMMTSDVKLQSCVSENGTEHSEALSSMRSHAGIGLPVGSHIRVTSSTDTEGCVHQSFQTEESELGTDISPVQCLFPAYAKPCVNSNVDPGVNASQEVDSAIVPDISQSIISNISVQTSQYTSPADSFEYASPDSVNDRSLSNVFEGIHITPSDKSVHSFTSTFSDSYSHLDRDTRRVYKGVYRGIGLGRNVQNTSDRIVTGDLDEQSFLTRSFMLDDIPNPQPERSFMSFASSEDTSRCFEDLERVCAEDMLCEDTKRSESLGGGVEPVGILGFSDKQVPPVKGRGPLTDSKTGVVELDVIAAPELSVTNILILLFVLLLAVGVCIYLKGTGLTALLKYYSWWEILYKNIDVTKIGETLF
ncbi:uncharacterized protein LOC124144989 [Haliotis rufescens]|uniref:uncharacterized protein LOC124144989 n=1 Tax=Haliotis rufescens TaxID=6454 RepID=UPI00201F636A|nr:uncharacterized protein LOC124144989 [Haliotis rufescens]